MAVILINTKRGKQGKPQVSFRTESAILPAWPSVIILTVMNMPH